MMLLDDVDHQLVELLGTSGRTTNRVLASKVGLTEATVAARLRRLADGDVLTVRPQFDWVAAGFTVHALVFLRVKGDRKSTRLNSSHSKQSRMPSSA